MAEGGCKLEMNIPLQQIYANSKRGRIIEGGVMYGTVSMLLINQISSYVM